MAPVLDHAIGVLVAGHAALALHGRLHMGEGVHAGGVYPAEERPVDPNLPLHEIHGRIGRLVVDGLHPLAVQRTRVLDAAVARGPEEAARGVRPD